MADVVVDDGTVTVTGDARALRRAERLTVGGEPLLVGGQQVTIGLGQRPRSEPRLRRRNARTRATVGTGSGSIAVTS